jgi:hypothetical protein
MAILFLRSKGIYHLVTHHNGHRVWRSTGKPPGSLLMNCRSELWRNDRSKGAPI